MDHPVILSRPWPEDAERITRALADWDTVRWLTTLPWPYRLEDARDFIATAGLDEHAIRMDDALVGMVQAGRVFGIWIAPDCQGRGIGQRAAVLALSRLFATGAASVQAHCLLGNHRSRHLLDRMGFAETGRLTLQSRPQGGPVEAHALELTRAGFAARHAFSVTTPRLRIDPLRPQDGPDLDRLLADPRIARMIPATGPDLGADQGDGLGLPLRLAVRRDGRMIGAIGVTADRPPMLRFLLDPDHAGQGLGQEMVAAVLAELAARHDLPEIAAECFLDDLAARHLLKNQGFRRFEDMTLPAARAEGRSAAALYRWRRGLLA